MPDRISVRITLYGHSFEAEGDAVERTRAADLAAGVAATPHHNPAPRAASAPSEPANKEP